MHLFAGSQSKASVGVRVRRNMAVGHFIGAAKFSNELATIEQDPSADFEDKRARSTAVLMMTVAGLEAFINERFEDANEVFTPSQLAAFIPNKKDISWLSILEKYDKYLEITEKPKLKKGTSHHQAVTTLISMRNAVVHFMPAFEGESAQHAKLAKALKGKFTPNEFGGLKTAFPRGWECHGFTRWAFISANGLLDQACQAAGLENPLDKHGLDPG